jgi:hypothetical protein
MRKLFLENVEVSNNSPIVLPESLESLYVGYGCKGVSNLIKEYPQGLKELEYRKCGRGQLPPLPPSLKVLRLTRDGFEEYASELPPRLEVLDLFESGWTTLPDLPSSLKELNIWGMDMERLPSIGDNVKSDLFLL